MKTFERFCAQGDVVITRIDKLPSGVLHKVEPEDGKVIVAHSETGHHHVMSAEHTTMYRPANDIYNAFLDVKKDDVLRHLRDYDTHEDILYTPGLYHIHRQRETAPEGFRRALD